MCNRALWWLSWAWLAGFSAAWGDEPAARDFDQLPVGTWVKLTPLAATPVSPRLGYEGACVWDSKHQRMIRYGGHNQGGGGEQHSEIWSFDPITAVWKLHEPNISPPGICCGQQNVFDPIRGRYIRFPAFSASHGWQWLREVYLNNASVWTYDLATNQWRDMRPYPTAHPSPLRCATWDSEHQVIVMFGGEGNREGTQVYDPFTNAWRAMRPEREPNFRSGGNMAYDPRHRVHVLFGAQFDDDRHTWIYDLRTNTWRDAQPPSLPPTDKNDAVLTYDERSGRILTVAMVTTGEGDAARRHLETWAYDVGENRWTPLKPEREPDPTGSRARQLMYAPQLGVALLENRPSNSSGVAEQQVWAFRSTDEKAPSSPAAPTELTALADEGAVRLAWRPAAGAARQVVYRGRGEWPWKVEFAAVATLDGQAAAHVDRDVAKGEVHHYYIAALDAAGAALGRSSQTRAQPRVVEDVVVSVLGEKEAEIAWTPLAEDDIVGYHVERAAVEVVSDDQHKRLKAQTPPLASPSAVMIRRVGPFARLTSSPLAAQRFVDDTVDFTTPTPTIEQPLDERRVSNEDFDPEGRPYRWGVFAYRVVAVNRLGVEGGASPARFTLPAPPESVFAKEEGTACRVKWEDHPQRKLAGYRIYRMDGRFNKEPITRLTADPITETTFTDATAGKPTRRYYVVAVDALGQEGFPSSPVWFEREWKPFYLPFTGEWHQ